MSRLITADASKISGADFIRALRPQKDALTLKLERLWTAACEGDRETIAAIHAEYDASRKLTEKVEAELRHEMKRRAA